jgi:hypothetical protein
MKPHDRLKQSILNSKMAGKICSTLGIDLHQYRILLNLFNTLGNRLEFMNTTINLQRVLGWYAVLSILFSLVALGDPSLQSYLLLFIVTSMVILLMTILQDAAQSLLDPDEATILAHHPIRGATYVAAKLTHLLTIVIVVVPSLNLAPAFVGIFLTESRWYYPITHLAAAYLAGLFVAFFICAIYGWLFLLISPAKLKNTVLWLQVVVPFLFLASFHLMRLFIADEKISQLLTGIFSLPWMPWRWFVAVGLIGHVHYNGWIAGEALTGCILTGALIAFGLRSFRADYLIKASSLIQGRSAPAISTPRISRLGILVRKLTGAPSGYGAFSFMGILCRRDWNFRRQVLMNGALFAIFGLAAGIAGIRTSPFGSMGAATLSFSPIHIFPHSLGLIMIFACSLLSYTSTPKGAVVFISHPIQNYRIFLRGIYLLPWLYVIVLPHLCLLGPCIWSWSASHALLFFSYSIFLSSFYLALGFFFVEGFPFVNAFKPSRFAEMQIPILGAMILMVLIAGIQWVLFRSLPLALGATVGVAILAVILLLISMRRMETKARQNLQLLNLTPQSIFKESD